MQQTSSRVQAFARLALAVGAGLGAVAAGAAQPSQADVSFMQAAAAQSHAEVIAGKVATTNASGADVRSFGERLMRDHMNADRRLDRLAMRLGVQLRSRPDGQQQDQLRRLEHLTGFAFDRAFLADMGVAAHQRAIALFQHESRANNAAPAVRQFASDILPVLQEHLRIAQQLQGQQQARGEKDDGVPWTARHGGMHAARSANGPARNAQAGKDQGSDAQQQLQQAVQVVQRMKSDPHVAELLQNARGVFILPHRGRAAAGIGAKDVEGLLVTRGGSGFSDPVFYEVGGLSVGAQAGGPGDDVALLLMTDKAVREFRSGKNLSLDADAGVRTRASSGRDRQARGKGQEILVWSGAQGVNAVASVALADIVLDQQANRAYYGRDQLTASAILDGQVENPHNNILGRVLGI